MSGYMPHLKQLSQAAMLESTHDGFHEGFVDGLGLDAESFYEHPHSSLVHPIFQPSGDQAMVGVILALIGWDRFFANLLPPNVNGIYGVLANTCGQMRTYIIRGNQVRRIRSNCGKTKTFFIHLTLGLLHVGRLVYCVGREKMQQVALPRGR